MPDANALEKNYKTFSDRELLDLRSDGSFSEEAEQVLDKELARRKLTFDGARRYYAPEWLDKADMGLVGIIELDDGERITAEVVGLNEDGDRLSVKVVSPDSHPWNSPRNHRDFPLRQIVSFEPQPHLMRQWPFSDPCRDRSSRARFVLMTTLFLSWVLGSLPLFFLLMNEPYGFQEASIIIYTIFGIFFTFARIGGGHSGPDLPPFKFRCPAVEPQIPRLLWRHLGFLAALFTLQTAMLAIRPHLPDWWNMYTRKGATPFDLSLLLLCFGLEHISK